jgi:hypothetical protein
LLHVTQEAGIVLVFVFSEVAIDRERFTVSHEF